MLIGVPKEIKNEEYRVGMVPFSVMECTSRGHQVIVERDAGAGVGFTNAQYEAAGATVVDSAQEIFAQAEMVVKVKEPQPEEFQLIPSWSNYFYLFAFSC